MAHFRSLRGSHLVQFWFDVCEQFTEQRVLPRSVLLGGSRCARCGCVAHRLWCGLKFPTQGSFRGDSSPPFWSAGFPCRGIPQPSTRKEWRAEYEEGRDAKRASLGLFDASTGSGVNSWCDERDKALQGSDRNGRHDGKHWLRRQIRLLQIRLFSG